MPKGAIISCSTGTSSGAALAIIRITGFQDLHFFRESFQKDLLKIEPRKIYLSKLFKLEKDQKKILDEVMFTYFEGPNSYSGENMLELYVHGNSINVDQIISHFIISYGFQLAKPGEFTLRAIQNGKMSFSQAEGLHALLTANSEFVMSQGLEMLSGDLNLSYKTLYRNFLSIKSAVDMQIDFSEDVGTEACIQQLTSALNESLKILDGLFERIQFKSASLIESKIVLIGPPNSGKSSLFNNLLKKNRAIVSAIPGTTRDYIEGLLNLEGQQFTLVDTAGLRATSDPIEKQGVEYTKELYPNAFLTIYVHNPALDFPDGIESVDLLVITHLDKFTDLSISNLKVPFKYENLIKLPIGPIGPDKTSGPIGANDKSGSIGPEFNDESLKEVKSLIINRYKDVTSRNPIVIERQVLAIKEMHSNAYKLKSNLSEYKNNNDLAITSFYVDQYGRSIQQLLGIIDSEHILNYIFSNFCIGK